MVGMESMVNIGDKIRIIREESQTTKFYPSQILDITGENTFIISGPIHKKNIVILHKDEIIEIGYLVKNKGMYIFNGKILNRDYSQIYKLEIEKISEIRKFQQRAYYRFETSIPVFKKQIIENEDGNEIIIENCRTKDISGSGLKLFSNFEHSVGDKILCQFHIDSKSIEAKSEIVRIEDIDTFDFKYALGINFIDIREKDRDVIIKFIFKEERLLREKGMI